MKEETKSWIEIGIEGVVEILLCLYQFGAEQMELPHNFWVGLGSWVAATLIGIRMFWIFPLWSNKLGRRTKIAIVSVALVAFFLIFYSPVIDAYHKHEAMHSAKSQQSVSLSSLASQGSTEAPPVAAPPRNKKPLAPASTSPHLANGSGYIGGDVEQGPCSVLQNGGQNNSAHVECGTPERKLTETQKHALAAAVADLPPHVKLEVHAAAVGNDTTAFAQDIRKALGKGTKDFIVWDQSLGDSPDSDDLTGIIIVARKGQSDIISKFCDDLEATKIEAICPAEDPSLPTNWVEVYVGPSKKQKN